MVDGGGLRGAYRSYGAGAAGLRTRGIAQAGTRGQWLAAIPARRPDAAEYHFSAEGAANLQDLPQVEVLEGDATHPVDHWLDGLKDGGQLVLPLTPDTGAGIVIGIRRRGERFFATLLSPIFIYRCAGTRDPQSAAALAGAEARWPERGHAFVSR